MNKFAVALKGSFEIKNGKQSYENEERDLEFGLKPWESKP